MKLSEVLFMAKRGRIVGIEGAKLLADEVERLTIENKRLEGEIREGNAGMKILSSMMDDLQGEIKELKTHNNNTGDNP